MKNAILLHGSSSSPNHFWLPSIKKFLEDKGYEVWAPQLPKPEAPDLKYQLPVVLKGGKFASETILIGHSSGCPLILSVLERINVKVDKAIFVAGYGRQLGKMEDGVLKQLEKDAEPILQDSYDWQKIKSNVQESIIINSDNDPWGCDDKEGEYLQQHLGGRLIVTHDGHMGSEKFNQPYLQFPLLEQIISS